ncbi:MAG: InaA protein [Pseudomonadales bacterium RIFCSPLOWO2_12_59_9]|nr:lipopolysaccharide kinase InaA family protein [Pseudomonas sp.]OHC28128.1 MAG: InaA protein [Pseudomonadales bacterium RIFCSPLOWO2_12_59_9]
MPADVNALLKLPSAQAFDQWLALPGEWVEEPNLRRGGESGVKRVMSSTGKLLYRKQQVGHIYRPLLHPFGYPTAMRERKVLLACAALKVIVPALVYAECRKVDGVWQALLITEALEGFSSLEECYARGDEQLWGEALHLRVLQEVGACLARFNLGRWQHGCLRMKHVFVRVQGTQIEIALLDLEKSRQRLRARTAAVHDIQQLKRHSSWSAAQWQAFIYGYETTFGSSFKGM